MFVVVVVFDSKTMNGIATTILIEFRKLAIHSWLWSAVDWFGWTVGWVLDRNDSSIMVLSIEHEHDSEIVI